ncbi:uncharacterized protein EV422DRAFT_144676 [Fimicolochytrium jonesii]|uniref:uncharacterized protein n=1 Tax=Fimicolochytrium jonesii TaxID=1396493 RepID=UPI0022FDB35E|nr:uncharacterized protein EV422DRAFT_144676 [Fimicolochytrium jonesii]KAI8825874.1 hypothetical protein EV422DRAFT_144676 [Fimicolochytrium jonesii]
MSLNATFSHPKDPGHLPQTELLDQEDLHYFRRAANAERGAGVLGITPWAVEIAHTRNSVAYPELQSDFESNGYLNDHFTYDAQQARHEENDSEAGAEQFDEGDTSFLRSIFPDLPPALHSISSVKGIPREGFALEEARLFETGITYPGIEAVLRDETVISWAMKLAEYERALVTDRAALTKTLNTIRELQQSISRFAERKSQRQVDKQGPTCDPPNHTRHGYKGLAHQRPQTGGVEAKEIPLPYPAAKEADDNQYDETLHSLDAFTIPHHPLLALFPEYKRLTAQYNHAKDIAQAASQSCDVLRANLVHAQQCYISAILAADRAGPKRDRRFAAVRIVKKPVNQIRRGPTVEWGSGLSHKGRKHRHHRGWANDGESVAEKSTDALTDEQRQRIRERGEAAVNYFRRKKAERKSGRQDKRAAIGEKLHMVAQAAASIRKATRRARHIATDFDDDAASIQSGASSILSNLQVKISGAERELFRRNQERDARAASILGKVVDDENRRRRRESEERALRRRNAALESRWYACGGLADADALSPGAVNVNAGDKEAWVVHVVMAMAVILEKRSSADPPGSQRERRSRRHKSAGKNVDWIKSERVTEIDGVPWTGSLGTPQIEPPLPALPTTKATSPGFIDANAPSVGLDSNKTGDELHQLPSAAEGKELRASHRRLPPPNHVKKKKAAPGLTPKLPFTPVPAIAEFKDYDCQPLTDDSVSGNDAGLRKVHIALTNTCTMRNALKLLPLDDELIDQGISVNWATAETGPVTLPGRLSPGRTVGLVVRFDPHRLRIVRARTADSLNGSSPSNDASYGEVSGKIWFEAEIGNRFCIPVFVRRGKCAPKIVVAPGTFNKQCLVGSTATARIEIQNEGIVDALVEFQHVSCKRLVRSVIAAEEDSRGDAGSHDPEYEDEPSVGDELFSIAPESLVVPGYASGWAQVTLTPPLSAKPGNYITTFIASFTPLKRSAVGTSDSVNTTMTQELGSILSELPDQTFSLTASIIAPPVEANPAVLDVGTCVAGHSTRSGLELRNHGRVGVRVHVMEGASLHEKSNKPQPAGTVEGRDVRTWVTADGLLRVDIMPDVAFLQPCSQKFWLRMRVTPIPEALATLSAADKQRLSTAATFQEKQSAFAALSCAPRPFNIPVTLKYDFEGIEYMVRTHIRGTATSGDMVVEPRKLDFGACSVFDTNGAVRTVAVCNSSWFERDFKVVPSHPEMMTVELVRQHDGGSAEHQAEGTVPRWHSHSTLSEGHSFKLQPAEIIEVRLTFRPSAIRNSVDAKSELRFWADFITNGAKSLSTKDDDAAKLESDTSNQETAGHPWRRNRKDEDETRIRVSCMARATRPVIRFAEECTSDQDNTVAGGHVEFAPIAFGSSSSVKAALFRELTLTEMRRLGLLRAKKEAAKRRAKGGALRLNEIPTESEGSDTQSPNNGDGEDLVTYRFGEHKALQPIDSIIDERCLIQIEPSEGQLRQGRTDFRIAVHPLIRTAVAANQPTARSPTNGSRRPSRAGARKSLTIMQTEEEASHRATSPQEGGLRPPTSPPYHGKPRAKERLSRKGSSTDAITLLAPPSQPHSNGGNRRGSHPAADSTAEESSAVMTASISGTPVSEAPMESHLVQLSIPCHISRRRRVAHPKADNQASSDSVPDVQTVETTIWLEVTCQVVSPDFTHQLPPLPISSDATVRMTPSIMLDGQAPDIGVFEAPPGFLDFGQVPRGVLQVLSIPLKNLHIGGSGIDIKLKPCANWAASIITGSDDRSISRSASVFEPLQEVTHIPAGTAGKVEIAYIPMTEGQVSLTRWELSSPTTRVHVYVRGECVVPRLAWVDLPTDSPTELTTETSSPKALDSEPLIRFADLCLGDQATQMLKIRNAGTVPVSFQIAIDPDEAELQDALALAAAEEMAPVEIKLPPTAPEAVALEPARPAKGGKEKGSKKKSEAIPVSAIDEVPPAEKELPQLHYLAFTTTTPSVSNLEPGASHEIPIQFAPRFESDHYSSRIRVVCPGLVDGTADVGDGTKTLHTIRMVGRCWDTTTAVVGYDVQPAELKDVEWDIPPLVFAETVREFEIGDGRTTARASLSTVRDDPDGEAERSSESDVEDEEDEYARSGLTVPPPSPNLSRNLRSREGESSGQDAYASGEQFGSEGDMGGGDETGGIFKLKQELDDLRPVQHEWTRYGVVTCKWQRVESGWVLEPREINIVNMKPPSATPNTAEGADGEAAAGGKSAGKEKDKEKEKGGRGAKSKRGGNAAASPSVPADFVIDKHEETLDYISQLGIYHEIEPIETPPVQPGTDQYVLKLDVTEGTVESGATRAVRVRVEKVIPRGLTRDASRELNTNQALRKGSAAIHAAGSPVPPATGGAAAAPLGDTSKKGKKKQEATLAPPVASATDAISEKRDYTPDPPFSQPIALESCYKITLNGGLKIADPASPPLPATENRVWILKLVAPLPTTGEASR